MRSTDSENSYSGFFGSLVRFSTDRPATPVAAHLRTFSATPAGSSAKPDSKSALTGRSVAADSSRQVIEQFVEFQPVVAAPRDQAKPALVDASAL